MMNHNINTSYVLDIHTHTLASGHAYGTLREMAQAAAVAGLSVLGISEHGPGTPGTCDPLYFLNLNVVPERLCGVRLLHGCEINVRNDGRLWLDQRYLERLDYGIVGIHGICYENAGKRKNTENLISCMRNEKIRFVSHPDDGNMPLDYELLVPAAKEYHVALEVNNNSLLRADRLDCLQNYQTMLTLCDRLRVSVIVSSDAHDPSSVGRFDKARQLLRQMDFDEELILNTSAEKLLAHLK
jgi:putative hydrolase